MKNLMENLASITVQSSADPGDYLNEKDKLIYCGRCHTPRQMRLKHPFADGKDTVYIPCECREKKRVEEAQQYAISRHYEIVDRLRQQGIRDAKILEWTFANDNGTTALMEKAKKYVDNFEEMRRNNVGLLLWGDVGTGKSFFAGCIANALIDKEVSVCMTNFGVILADMMNLKIDKNEYMENLSQRSLLIIDDFGMERNTSFALEQLYNVIDRRYTASKPLIITTNLTLGEMQDVALPVDLRRIYDRVLEMCVPILFTGESKRKSKAIEKRNILKEILK